MLRIIAPEADFDDEDVQLTALARQAETFLVRQRWCSQVLQVAFCYGFKHFAVLLAKIDPLGDADANLWVVVGDTSPAYFDLESCPTAISAVEAYSYWLSEWRLAVLEGRSTNELMPLFTVEGSASLPETMDNCDLIEGRLRFIENTILPDMRSVD